MSIKFDLPPSLSVLLSVTGLLTILYVLYNLISYLRLYTRKSSLPKYLRKNAYALVTGASDGIGLAFADELAARGFNVILHGRNPSKLDTVKASLQTKHKQRKFEKLVVNASDRDINFEKVIEPLKDKPITVLVNNVGGTPNPTARKYAYLEDKTTDEVDGDLYMNARFPTQFTRVMIPILGSNPAALIMNIGSMGSIYGAPLLTTYAGSKGYNSSWSNTLRLDMKVQPRNIEVMLVQCGQVQSQFIQGLQGFFVVTTRQFVNGSLRLVGCGKGLVFGSWKHFVLHQLASWLPQNRMDNLVIHENHRTMLEVIKDL